MVVMRLGALSFQSSLRRTVIATTAPIQHPPVEACLAQLLDHLGIAGAHFAGRSLADVQGFIAKYPDRVATMTLVCPTVLNPRSLAPLGARLMVLTGDHGLGARRVQAVLPDLPEATAVVLDDYAGLTWADLAADRGDDIDAAIREFHQRRAALPAAGLREQEGEIAGISFRIRGAGPPLVLLPLDLSPGQWEPLIPALSALLLDHPRRPAARQRRQPRRARPLRLYGGGAGAARRAGDPAGRERARGRLRVRRHHARAGAAGGRR